MKYPRVHEPGEHLDAVRTTGCERRGELGSGKRGVEPVEALAVRAARGPWARSGGRRPRRAVKFDSALGPGSASYRRWDWPGQNCSPSGSVMSNGVVICWT